MTLHNHRRAKDQLSTTHKLSGSLLEWRRLKELGQDYAELQPPIADHPLGYDAWKDFQRMWGQAEDTYSLSSNSSFASLPASEDHEDEEETTSFTVFGPAGEAALSLSHDLPATTYILLKARNLCHSWIPSGKGQPSRRGSE